VFLKPRAQITTNAPVQVFSIRISGTASAITLTAIPTATVIKLAATKHSRLTSEATARFNSRLELSRRPTLSALSATPFLLMAFHARKTYAQSPRFRVQRAASNLPPKLCPFSSLFGSSMTEATFHPTVGAVSSLRTTAPTLVASCKTSLRPSQTQFSALSRTTLSRSKSLRVQLAPSRTSPFTCATAFTTRTPSSTTVPSSDSRPR